MALMDSYLIDGIKNGNKIGLRAENITIVPNGEGRLSCSVSEAEFLGSETLIGLEHEGTIGLNVLQPGLSIVPSGQKIDITFDDQDLHTFNSAGERINGQ
jgi:sn-glycerol 3-phosphate transport system ATP-binding protein